MIRKEDLIRAIMYGTNAVIEEDAEKHIIIKIKYEDLIKIIDKIERGENYETD